MGNKRSAVIPPDLVEMLNAEDKRHGRPAGTMLSVMKQEVGGQLDKFLADPSAYHYGLNAQGKRIAPHTGKISTAFGPFGILESTAKNPGYGVKPLQNKSLQEQARFASDYLQARSKSAGGLKEGLAGYGEGDKYAWQVANRIKSNQPQMLAQTHAQPREKGLIERAFDAVIPTAYAGEVNNMTTSTVQSQPKRPKKWSQVVESEAFKKLSAEDKIRAQESYFETVVAPRVPAEKVDVARSQFFKQYNYAPTAQEQIPTKEEKVALTQQPVEQEAEPKPHQLEAVQPKGDPSKGGFLDGVVMGIRDPLDAGAQMLYRAVDGTAFGRNINALNNWIADKTGLVGRVESKEDLDNMINAVNQEYEAGRKVAGRDGIDFARFGGNIVSSIPMMATGAGTAGAGAGLAARVGLGAVTGAGYGTMQPVIGVDKQANFLEEKGKQAVLGGLLGGATPMVAGAIGRVLSPKASRAGSAARSLLDEGVELTPGQILGGVARRVEDKLMSAPVLGDAIYSARERGQQSLNKAVYNRVLAPIGKKTDKLGREAVDDIKFKIKEAYGDVLNKVKFRADNQFNQELAELKHMVQDLPAREARAFKKALARGIENPLAKANFVDGITFKRMESQIGEKAKDFLKANDEYQNEVGRALNEVQNSLRSALERANPKYAQELQKINQAFALQARLQGAASHTGTDSGVFTPSQLLSAVRAGDSTVRKNAFARGRAMMQDLAENARNLMQSKVPNSGTIDRLLWNGGTLYASTLNPAVPISLGVGSVAYLPGVNKAVTKLLTTRPDVMHNVATRLDALPAGLLAPLGNYRD